MSQKCEITVPYKFKRSLHIGINYPDTPNELHGCQQDVWNLRDRLSEIGVDFGESRFLVDDGAENTVDPTRDNILDGLAWVSNELEAGDWILVQYSGHGSYEWSNDKGESDGKDETLVPCDVETAGMVYDDEIHNVLFKDLPEGVNVLFLADCCHSGTVCDLGYQLKAVRNGSGYARGWWDSYPYPYNVYFRNIFAPRRETIAEMKAVRADLCKANVLAFSGCKDSQTSKEINGRGAMTYAFLKNFTECFNNKECVSLATFMKRLDNSIAEQDISDQTPQLSSSYAMSGLSTLNF